MADGSARQVAWVKAVANVAAAIKVRNACPDAERRIAHVEEFSFMKKLSILSTHFCKTQSNQDVGRSSLKCRLCDRETENAPRRNLWAYQSCTEIRIIVVLVALRATAALGTIHGHRNLSSRDG